MPLSLANWAGTSRFCQATRELIKAYALGVTVVELDELFPLFVWNGGGTFFSEIGPPSLFGAYRLIKTGEGEGSTREEVMSDLMEHFGDQNPEVNVMHQDRASKQSNSCFNHLIKKSKKRRTINVLFSMSGSSQ